MHEWYNTNTDHSSTLSSLLFVVCCSFWIKWKNKFSILDHSWILLNAIWVFNVQHCSDVTNNNVNLNLLECKSFRISNYCIMWGWGRSKCNEFALLQKYWQFIFFDNFSSCLTFFKQKLGIFVRKLQRIENCVSFS